MASPLAAVRQPLGTRAINTHQQQHSPLSHKRPHSQITTTGQENVIPATTSITSLQSHIFNSIKQSPQSLVLPTFKHPLPKNPQQPRAHARNQTALPVTQHEDLEMKAWRKSTTALIQRSTFYFDTLEKHFEQLATALVNRLHGVSLSSSIYLFIESCSVLFQYRYYYSNFTRNTCSEFEYIYK